MKIFYKNVDISNSVNAKECYFDSYADKNGDTLKVKIKDADNVWDKYNPHIGDKIKITGDNISTGEMNVVSVVPESGYYTIYATSLPVGWDVARKMEWNRITFKQLCRDAAKRHDLEYKDYDSNDRAYPYLCQDMQNDFEFLQKLAIYEGNAICVKDGSLITYGIDKLEGKKVSTVLKIDASNRINFERKTMYGECTVIANGEKYTYTARSGPELVKKLEIEADSLGTLEKYAENLLKAEDRTAETGRFYTKPLINMSAGTVTVLWSDKNTFNGRIFIEHVRHDFLNNQSKVFFRKVVDYAADVER